MSRRLCKIVVFCLLQLLLIVIPYGIVAICVGDWMNRPAILRVILLYAGGMLELCIVTIVVLS